LRFETCPKESTLYLDVFVASQEHQDEAEGHGGGVVTFEHECVDFFANSLVVNGTMCLFGGKE
jgi:hypothetical protein